MREKHTFRAPLGKDLNGLYITEAQMRFFLNRKKGTEHFLFGDPIFYSYFYKCAVYNVVWDLLDKYPDCATLFWDEEKGSIGMKFPINGEVMQELKRRKVSYFFSEDDD